MIASEERTHERFPHGQQDKGYDPRSNQGGQSTRNRGPDNTLASMDRSKKSNKNNKKFEDQRTPNTRWPSVDNSKNWVSIAKATRAWVKLITTKMKTTMLTLAFNSLTAKSQQSLWGYRLHQTSAQGSWLFGTSWQESPQHQSTLIDPSTRSSFLEKINGLA